MLLAINSSTFQFSIALMTMQGVVIAEYMVTPKRNTFTGFIPAIDQLMDTSGSEIENLKFVAVAVGPGSFTGLRVGLAAAKGIAYSMKIPLIGVSGIDALASSIPYTEKPVCAMIASRRNEAFYAFFRRSGDEFVRESEDKSIAIRDIGSLVKYPAVVVGNDFEKQKALIEESGNPNIIPARQDHWCLRASSIGMLGLDRFHDGSFDDVWDIVPSYMAAPDIRQSK